MAITKNAPNTIHLSGPCCEVMSDEFVNSVAATPGMLAEMVDDGGANKWKPHASADEYQPLSIFLDQPEYNLTIDSVVAIGATPKIGYLCPGSVFYGIVVSGQNIANSEYLQSNGDGKLKSATATTATAGLARYQSLDNLGLVAVDTRCRVQIVG